MSLSLATETMGGVREDNNFGAYIFYMIIIEVFYIINGYRVN